MPDFTVNITNGSADADGQAARYIVQQENERRAGLETPEAPLPLTPLSALQDSYEICLERVLASAHTSYINQAAKHYAKQSDREARWALATDAQRDAALAQLPSLP